MSQHACGKIDTKFLFNILSLIFSFCYHKLHVFFFCAAVLIFVLFGKSYFRVLIKYIILQENRLTEVNNLFAKIDDNRRVSGRCFYVCI